MWCATREEGFDDPRPTKRGPCMNLNDALGGFLRLGLFLQLFSLTCLYVAFWINGGFGLFSYDLEGMPESGRSDETFRNMLAIFSGIYLIGSMYIMAFQCLLADDACWARGYRAGSKIMRMAAFFDSLSSLFQFIFYLYVAKFYTTKWYVHFCEGGSELVYFSFARVLHSFAFVMYGGGTYLLEAYHDEGAGDLHAYINACFFFIAAASEVAVIFFKSGSVCTALIWLALLVCAVWAYFFEPEVNAVSPALHETELTNDVEQQVEVFASKTPYRLQDQNVPLQQLVSTHPNDYAY